MDRAETWEAGYYKVRRVLDHRVAHGGTLEYEIEWAGNKKNGDAWDLDWVAADALTPDLIHEYMLKRMHGVPTVHVSVNASLAYEEVRRKLADVM